MKGRIMIGLTQLVTMLDKIRGWALAREVLGRHLNFISLCLFGLIFTLSTPALAADPLFGQDAPIKLRIEAPMAKIVRHAKRRTDPMLGRLSLETPYSETHAITVAARGKSRRTLGFCKFPPLRVKFPQKPASHSFFKGQKSLKLVTHCQKSTKFQTYMLSEYTAYRMLNVLTPQSLKVRLAYIEYVDSESGKHYATRYGFFIEDGDDAARRNGLKELDLGNITRAQLDPQSAARGALFGYMIGNLDFSMINGPAGSECCHNGKLFGRGKTASQSLIFIPYDFDQTGFVNASYATPPPNLKVRNVRERVYRGYCEHNAHIRQQAENFKRTKSEILAVLNTITTWPETQRQTARKYLNAFYTTLENPETFERKIIGKCRK